MIKNLVGAVPDDNLGIAQEVIRRMREEEGFTERLTQFVYGEEISLRPFGKLERRLSRVFGKRISVDPQPEVFTPEFLARMARYNLKPVFQPGEDISAGRSLRRYTKPEQWFYDQVMAGKVKQYENLAPTALRRGWYLADFTGGVDYTNGTQVLSNDPWAPLITRLRQEQKIGRHNNTPDGSRFSITPEEWEKVVVPAMNDELQLPAGCYLRLKRCIEHNFIGNLYDRQNRGQYNMWQWFSDVFEDSIRLYGGYRGSGGLARVLYAWSVVRFDNVTARPLVNFVN